VISLQDEVWSSDVKNWPKVDLSQIFSFVLSRKEQDMDFVGHYKTQKAYSYYQSGFVEKQNKVYQYGKSSQI
jgi:hypothetical protein